MRNGPSQPVPAEVFNTPGTLLSTSFASGASDVQVANQMGHRKIETTKNIYGHLFAQDRKLILKAINQAVSRLYVEWRTAQDEAA
jgi:hypothetical protein